MVFMSSAKGVSLLASNRKSFVQKEDKENPLKVEKYLSLPDPLLHTISTRAATPKVPQHSKAFRSARCHVQTKAEGGRKCESVGICDTLVKGGKLAFTTHGHNH